MKKISIYSFLAASLIFTGCGTKEVSQQDLQSNNVNSSESVLNTIPDTNIDNVMDGSFTMGSKVSNGVNYIINGKEVLIENVYFKFDRYDLTSSMKEVAMNNASKLSALNSSTTIRVEGNTDEWGTDEYNYALGLKRAKTVKDTLVNNGVTANVNLISYGESKPVCNEKNKKCWQMNRRVEHTLAK